MLSQGYHNNLYSHLYDIDRKCSLGKKKCKQSHLLSNMTKIYDTKKMTSSFREEVQLLSNKCPYLIVFWIQREDF